MLLYYQLLNINQFYDYYSIRYIQIYIIRIQSNDNCLIDIFEGR